MIAVKVPRNGGISSNEEKEETQLLERMLTMLTLLATQNRLALYIHPVAGLHFPRSRSRASYSVDLPRPRSVPRRPSKPRAGCEAGSATVELELTQTGPTPARGSAQWRRARMGLAKPRSSTERAAGASPPHYAFRVSPALLPRRMTGLWPCPNVVSWLVHGV